MTWLHSPLALHLLLAAAAVWPLVSICGRAGLARAWAAMVFVPLLGPALVATALAAYRWPTLQPRHGHSDGGGYSVQSFGELLCYVGGLAPWLSHLVVSLVIAYTLGATGLVFLRTGRSGLWALVFLVPYAGVLAWWVLALARWPRQDAGEGH
jgi:hypothetical protein